MCLYIHKRAILYIYIYIYKNHQFWFGIWAAFSVLDMAGIRRRSIELEPMTLNQGQLSQARKVAADVVQKMEPREASSLFTEGLEVENTSEKEVKEVDEDGEKEAVENEKEVGIDKVEIIDEKASMSLCSSAMVDSPDQLHSTIPHNEPLSAPF